MKPLIWAEIDLGAIAGNLRELRRLTDPRAKVMAVVKADGYGHGACEVARTALAAGAEWLGVARLHEAVRLRESGLAAPLLVLGYTPPEDAERLVEFDLRQSVYSLAAAEAYSAAARRRGGRIRVHVKVDTGMGRLGLVPAALAGGDAGRPGRGRAGPHGPGHRAPARAGGRRHLHAFRRLGQRRQDPRPRAAAALPGGARRGCGRAALEFALRHAANSAAVIELPESHLDLVRPGIALYGLRPSDEVELSRIRLTPAMTLKTRIIHLKEVPAGTCVSYGMTHRTPAPTVIATIPTGYADGYRRALSSKGEMLVGGRARAGRGPGLHGPHHARRRRRAGRRASRTKS